jgi:hypothetical protein
MMRYVARVLLPLTLLFYIAYEAWLKLGHDSLCSAEGCRLAGELLKFDSIYLDFMGMASVSVIALLGFLSIKRRDMEVLFFIVLYSSIAFESVMIGYQVAVNPEPCLFCMGVYGGLLSIALLSNRGYFAYALPVIASIFLAFGDLAIAKNESLVQGDGIYLVHSERCPHCKRVKKYFADHGIEYRGLSVNSPTVRFLVKGLGIDEIPVMIKKEGGKMEIVRGDIPIIASFSSPAKSEEKSGDMLTVPTRVSDIYADPSEAGCSISPLESSSCSEDEGVPPLR